MEPDRNQTVQIVALICLTTIVISSIVGITFTAVLTDRDLHFAEGLSFGGAILVAVLGGVSFAQLFRRHRQWKVSIDHQEDRGDDDRLESNPP